MNRIRNILLILILAFSNQVFADNSNNDVDALLLTVSAGSKLDSKTCEEKTLVITLLVKLMQQRHFVNKI